MADITKNLALTQEWQDVTTDLSLAASTTYLVDLKVTGPLNMIGDALAVWAKTNNTTAPTISGHPWRVAVSGLSSQARFVQNSNEHIWVKLLHGSASLIVTKV